MYQAYRFAARAMIVSVLSWITTPGFLLFSRESMIAGGNSRAEVIEAQRKDKTNNLSPAKLQGVEEALEKYIGEDPLNNVMGGVRGLRLKLGGLPSGGGFALGPEYYRADLAKGQMHFRVFASGSNKQWYLIGTELRFPHLADNYLDLDIHGRRLDANSVSYYGPGPDSNKAERTNFRREENALDISLSFKPTRRYLSLGVVSGYLWLNTGPGQSDLYTSTEDQFSPEATPGIDRQTDYLRTGLVLDVDSRDRPADPHAGTHFRVELNHLSDRKFDQYSFRQIESSIEQYLPFFNEKRVIALRARSVLSYPSGGNSVPFYMQPSLGGTSDLRGYQRYRFYDNNSFVMNVEYRWEIFTLLDAAVFADAGKVFHRDGDFNFEQL